MKIVNSFNQLIKVLGISPGDKVNMITPQFERDYELEINFTPQDEGELKALIESAPKDVLVKMGCAIWSSYTADIEDNEQTYLKPGEYHYLFPKEWYDYIPNGFMIVSILGEKKKFIHGKTDDDMRFGCLCYGFVRSF